MKLYKEDLVLYLYVLILIITYIIGDLSFKFNYIYLTCFVIIFCVIGINNRIRNNLLFFLPFFIFVSLNTDYFDIKQFFYLLQDLLMVFFIFFICDFIKYKNLSKEIQKKLFFFSILYIILYFLSTFDDSLYDMELGKVRYHGITGSTNVSSTTCVLFLIYIWEYIKVYFHRGKIICFILSFMILMLVTYVSKSRSLLLVLPYFIFQVFLLYTNIISRIIVSSIILSITIFIFLYNIDLIFDSLRISSDSSFNTREMITVTIIERIKDNYFFLPHGHNSGVQFLSDFLGEERYPIHNDFLKIIYEWGISGIIFLFISIGGLFVNKRNINNIFLLLFCMSSALHNILFLFYIWIPMMFIFSIKNRNDYNMGEKYGIR
ncbi:hypothetical protein [Lonepinella sp. BR2919]|uniref:hypothetical protein n=1 Tax=unclassified Lonepinella TaxID=2642006 RepID=UPI003F6E2065